MTPTSAAPCFGGRGESFASYSPEAEFWARVRNLDPTRRASALVLHMEPAAREVCWATGDERLLYQDGAAKLLQVLRDYFAPGAIVYSY